ncbi:hypothetical protein HMPREF1545_02406 [Oscillibacter sp. KLE 1728]|nr:hypothetical protein HMPREF1545_02406 [Oscillibacter sp. KLE 1728]ERK62118.1 hypothetical protein HMPREF1546_02795 [Oscillibacter sp. KLE 1745]
MKQNLWKNRLIPIKTYGRRTMCGLKVLRASCGSVCGKPSCANRLACSHGPHGAWSQEKQRRGA